MIRGSMNGSYDEKLLDDMLEVPNLYLQSEQYATSLHKSKKKKKKIKFLAKIACWIMNIL